jgi:uncharacterized Zn-binding protein involved in type VI secretion
VPPAATVGQTTAHASTPLSPGPGSPNVFFGGRPAWRVGIDFHACPLSDGPKPHVGGKVPIGSPTVMINGYPAARMGDKIVEASAPNAIVSGVESVIIG